MSDQLTLDSSGARASRATETLATTYSRGEPPTEPILRSVALGAVAGMRSLTPLALLAAAAQSPNTPVARSLARMGVLGRIGSRTALIALGLAAVGELVGDKLPGIPARIRPAPLAWRALVGATAGAITSAAAGGSTAHGARRGAAAAVVAAYAGYITRRAGARRTSIPDPVWGAVEDGVAIGLAAVALAPSLGLALGALFPSRFPSRVTSRDVTSGMEVEV